MKKAASIILAMLLTTTFTATGCSRGGKTSDDNSKNQAEQAADGEVSWKKDTSPVTFDTYIDYDWYIVDTWGKDDVSKEITKRTGVSLNVTKASDRNQLQVLLAADELPEIIFTDNQVQRFQNKDISYSFDELIKKYAPDFMNTIDPVEIVNNTAADGHFYTLKSHYNNKEAWEDPRNLPSPGSAGLYVREDILQELGNPTLESTDDLLNIFKMVKEKYPDMIVYIPHPTWTNPIMEYMGFNGGTYIDDQGKARIGFTQPGFVEYFKYYNKLFREGYVSQESFTYKPEQFFQIVRSGKVFAASYNSGLADETNKIFDENGIKGKFIPVIKPLKYNGEIKFKPMDAGIGWSSTFITKKNKNPERAIRYMQFLKSSEGDALTQWGIEGKHYTLTPEGLLKRPEGFENLKGQDTGIGPWYFMASGLGEGVAVSSRVLSSPKYGSIVELLKERKKYYERNPILYFTRPDADTDEFNINVKISDLYNNTQISIITSASEQEVVEKFDKMLADAEKIGLSKIENYMTEAYNKAKEKYDAIGK